MWPQKFSVSILLFHAEEAKQNEKLINLIIKNKININKTTTGREVLPGFRASPISAEVDDHNWAVGTELSILAQYATRKVFQKIKT